MNSCDIFILIAMQAEADLVINKLNLSSFSNESLAPLPSACYQGKYRGLNIVLATHGTNPSKSYDLVGTQFAAITTWALLKTYHPNIVINAGTAGGFIQQGANIGDVYVNAFGCQYHDRRISIPSYQEFSSKVFSSNIANNLSQHLSMLKSALVSTGNSLDTHPEEVAHIRRTGAQVKDMEAACVAEVASLFGKEIIALKAITDCLDGEHPSAEEFMKNLHFASSKLAEMVICVVDTLSANKNIS